MIYKVIPTPEFIKTLKVLNKKYKSIKKDILQKSRKYDKKNITKNIRLFYNKS